jgi:sRNA-binding carbon storage regulator CsrA
MHKQGLLVTRKQGEGIVIVVNNQKIFVSVESLGDRSTKIRVDAPKEYKIWRDELPIAQQS